MKLNLFEQISLYVTWNISTELQVGTFKIEEKIAKNECANN